MITWQEEECPHCQAINFSYDGDLNDLTRPDLPPAVKCWSCGELFIREAYLEDETLLEVECNIGPEDRYKTAEEYLESGNADYEEGEQRPN